MPMPLRRLAATALCCAFTACLPLRTTAVYSGVPEFGLVEMGIVDYLIDPRTETCVMLYSTKGAAIQVSCAKLKRNLPQAAQYITWEEAPAMVPRP